MSKPPTTYSKTVSSILSLTEEQSRFLAARESNPHGKTVDWCDDAGITLAIFSGWLLRKPENRDFLAEFEKRVNIQQPERATPLTQGTPVSVTSRVEPRKPYTPRFESQSMHYNPLESYRGADGDRYKKALVEHKGDFEAAAKAAGIPLGDFFQWITDLNIRAEIDGIASQAKGAETSSYNFWVQDLMQKAQESRTRMAAKSSPPKGNLRG